MTSIADLLDNADRIARFGIQSGRITDTKLLDAIERAKAANATGALTADSPEAGILAVAMQDGARQIAPTSVADLSRGYDPFANPPTKPEPKSGSWARALTLACTLLLVFTAGYYTLWHKRATDLMSFAIDEAVRKQDGAVLDVVLPMLVQPPAAKPDIAQTAAAVTSAVTAGAPAVETTTVVAPEETLRTAVLLRDADEIREMQQSIDYFGDRFGSLYRDRVIGYGQLLDLKGWLLGETEERQELPALPKLPSLLRPANAAAGAQPKATGELTNEEKEALFEQACASADRLRAGGAETYRDLAGELFGYAAMKGCVLHAMGIAPMDAVSLKQIRIQLFEFDHALSIVGLWLLPAIYGALGALVYYMRQFLDPLRPDPSLPRVVVRVALGAFAGITVGWFFTPTTAAQGFSFPDVGMATLTFAFLLGFSIEVFFSFLERLVNLSNEGIARLGKP